jgi:2-polyprenyl-3-methyl-5-hydroxy-6-metoxy-1,4-benzoquinol methylase
MVRFVMYCVNSSSARYHIDQRGIARAAGEKDVVAAGRRNFISKTQEFAFMVQGTDFDYDSLPVGYYDAVYHRGSGVQSKWQYLKFQRFADRMTSLERHLDIGCGPGTFIGTLPDNRHDSLGVDIASSQIAYANATYGGPGKAFLSIPAGRLLLDDNSFDVVTAIELIEHLTHCRALALLREALRILRPGGQLLVSTPNYASSWPLVEKLVSRFGGIDYSKQHIAHYRRRRLHDLLAEANVVDIRVEGYMLAAPFAAAVSWRLADFVERLEPAILADRFGLLLFASGTKHDGA